MTALSDWLARNFPVNTLPYFIPALLILLALNVITWRYIFRKRSS